ncbi:TetR/AcrR family transcriptional regulator [Roseivivax isoporae]|uniref:TetR family transcriptional regulator n=1 Tax=Roseivivax isoporae LMG 25204 TaxID=1449351 RepID=X7FAM4_9RHOB|nr:TetR/AcrR family transcriptional regulator [Roseivivax isoporae]ETX29151.1 TetR family transcriptional regulator [Roseivivax isoporae LMG 25204]
MPSLPEDSPDAAAEADGPRRRLPPEERREQIIDAAVRFFADVGLDGNTRDLAKRLGVTQSLIFRYFDSKQDLIEAVYGRVYLDRISPGWAALLRDRSRPVKERMTTFYREYGERIFDHDWMRIFMFSGLAGADLNRRYLDHLGRTLLLPMLDEIEAELGFAPSPEDLWNLHGGIVYIGIRKHIYQMPVPDDPYPGIERAIDRFLRV